MQRRGFCKLIGSARAAARAAVDGRPNIVYILADDLNWGDLGCYNRESAVPTPYADPKPAYKSTDSRSNAGGWLT